MRSCLYHTDATGAGELSVVSVTIWTSGAQGADDDDEPIVRTVNGRNACEKQGHHGPGAGSVSMCDYRLEVTTATSGQINSWALGDESLEPACRTAADLAADIEPRLPTLRIGDERRPVYWQLAYFE